MAYRPASSLDWSKLPLVAWNPLEKKYVHVGGWEPEAEDFYRIDYWTGKLIEPSLLNWMRSNECTFEPRPAFLKPKAKATPKKKIYEKEPSSKTRTAGVTEGITP